MNNTLLQHFNGIHDVAYISLKKIAIDNIAKCNTTLDGMKQFTTIERTEEILDYLITYVRNIIRMGFSTEEIDCELNTLYNYDDKNQELFNAIISKLSTPIKSGIPTELKQYEFYLKRIITDHTTDDSIDLSVYKDVHSSLEQYQALINKSAYDGENISDIFLSYQDSNTTNRQEMKALLHKGITEVEFELSSLYMRIKTYQYDLAASYGFNNPLEYIANKYCISYDTIEYMLSQTTNYKENIARFICRFDEFGIDQCDVLSCIMKPNKLKPFSLSFNETLDILEECFGRLDCEFGKMIYAAKVENWIDWEKRKGKLNGSYTNVIPFCKKSIISMSFDGSISDICKLAHELGHAFHGICVSEHSFYNTDFSVITAEMFGLFCENYALLYLMKHYMKPCDVKEWKREFYCNGLRTFLHNLIAFHFENKSFHSVKRSHQTPTDIYDSVLMDLGVKQEEDIQPYEWLFRSQNFFPDFFYYNFVYVIGEIVSLSLINDLVRKEIDFNAIKEMLTQSGIDNVDRLFDSINQNLHSASIYNIIRTLDQLWDASLDNDY